VNNVALYQRANELAAVLGITAEEAFRQAFTEWIDSRSRKILRFPGKGAHQ
jgi:hypothetical protein